MGCIAAGGVVEVWSDCLALVNSAAEGKHNTYIHKKNGELWRGLAEAEAALGGGGVRWAHVPSHGAEAGTTKVIDASVPALAICGNLVADVFADVAAKNAAIDEAALKDWQKKKKLAKRVAHRLAYIGCAVAGHAAEARVKVVLPTARRGTNQ